MGAWDDAEQETKGGSADFLRLDDGQSATVAFLGEPQTYTGKPYKDGGQPPTKVLINVFVISDKPPTLKIWDMAAAVFKTLNEIRKKGKFPLADWTFDVSRSGTGPSKTRYSIMPSEQLTPDRKKKLASIELRDVGEIAEKISFEDGPAAAPPPRRQAQAAPSAAAAPAPQDDSDIPF